MQTKLLEDQCLVKKRLTNQLCSIIIESILK